MKNLGRPSTSPIDISMRIVAGPALSPWSAQENCATTKLQCRSIEAIYIELKRPEDALKAGARREWRQTWRCLALVDRRALDLAYQRKQALIVHLSRR